MGRSSGSSDATYPRIFCSGGAKNWGCRISYDTGYEPKPRLCHYAGAVGGESFIFAGRTADFFVTKKELSSTIQVFDHYLEQWRELKTTGSPPKGLYDGGCCVSPSGDLYVYGGHSGSIAHGGLYKLSSRTLKWSQLSGESEVNGPMKKTLPQSSPQRQYGHHNRTKASTRLQGRTNVSSKTSFASMTQRGVTHAAARVNTKRQFRGKM